MSVNFDDKKFKGVLLISIENEDDLKEMTKLIKLHMKSEVIVAFYNNTSQDQAININVIDEFDKLRKNIEQEKLILKHPEPNMTHYTRGIKKQKLLDKKERIKTNRFFGSSNRHGY